MKTVLIGSVYSSEIILEEMIKIGFPINMVFSLDEEYSGNVSGYYPIHKTAVKFGIPYKKFHKISEEENINIIKQVAPDYIFVVGLSQLVDKRILNIPTKGTIGFHPTPLPKFRGRAAMVWQILLGVHETKCTMFMLDEGMDSGDILAQEPYYIDDNDYIGDVGEKLLVAMRRLCQKVLSGLKANSIKPIPQDEKEATYLLIRRPEDGRIDWNQTVKDIHKLIRAVSYPYPGAFGMYDGKHQIIIWRADIKKNTNIIGIPGQICGIEKDSFDVLGTDGIIHVTEYKNVDEVKLFVGHKLK